MRRAPTLHAGGNRWICCSAADTFSCNRSSKQIDIQGSIWDFLLGGGGGGGEESILNKFFQPCRPSGGFIRNFGGFYPAHSWNIFKCKLRLFLQNRTRLSLKFQEKSISILNNLFHSLPKITMV